jgi:tetratricopeptide (TPR) repeat protein
MSTLRIETLNLPAADLGPENPLPPLKGERDIHAQIAPIPGVSDEMLRNMTYGRLPNILPYTMQDGYTRDLHPRDFRVAVLENDYLRATFMLELGGRLWSLAHKPSGRELLEANPVFQPANLALRNAWFSGGVEWNIGTTGHTPFTCAPLFAARLTTPDSAPVLRLYEWERIRQVTYQIDAYLPDGSPVLFVRVRIVNPHDHDVPMYWWSNIAVPETPATRVLVPADSAYSFGYGKSGLRRVVIPNVDDGPDVTYPTNINRACDFFFHIPDEEHPWITALDGEGRGLIQTSTARLRGRKLFLWGMGAGGRRWQTFLSQKGRAYIEIQAGLARTQLEHLPMPGSAEWTWLEAYGLMEADPTVVHRADWTAARESVAERLESLISREALNAELARSATFADLPPEEIIQRGSGWGALERRRCEAAGERPFCSAALTFDDASLTEVQAPWLALLDEGALPALAPNAEPLSYMVQAEWRAMLEVAVLAGRANWSTWLHLGVMRYYAGERDTAREAWECSLHAEQTPWALRNLALLAWEDADFDEAVELYAAALRMRPALLPLAVECGQKLIAMERPQMWLDLLEILPDNLRAAGRIRLLEGQAALAIGDLDCVAQLFDGSLVIDDLREGERSLSHLWFDYHARRISAAEGIPIDDALHERVWREFPAPEALDFRMS